jgi:hypothetical protein
MLQYSHPKATLDSGIVQEARSVLVCLGLMALLGAGLIFLFPGSPEQDSGYHFAMAQAAWREPIYLVKVWARPLFTFGFAGPALVGQQTARFWALAISLLIAWQTWKLACDLRLNRAWLTLPLLLAQPTFFELFTDLLTEPVFALTFVVALRLHLLGRIRLGMLIASLLPLARPEGFFLCLLWGIWVLKRQFDRQSFAGAASVAPWLLVLGTGIVLWWIAALAITGDAAFIVHDWPTQWQNGTYGHDSIFGYSARAWEFIGPLLVVVLLLGLIRSFWLRKYGPITSAWLLFFVLHSVLRTFGLFGEAGYPRYMVSVAPATAIIILVGWNTIGSWQAAWWRRTQPIFGAIVMTSSVALSFLYLDSLIWSRDFIAIRDMLGWFNHNRRPVRRLIWSDINMCLQSNHTITDAPPLSSDRNLTLQILRNAPPQTLVFWDDNVGPKWFGLSWPEIQSAGFQVLHVQQYNLPGLFVSGKIGSWELTRRIQLSLLYKP